MTRIEHFRPSVDDRGREYCPTYVSVYGRLMPLYRNQVINEESMERRAWHLATWDAVAGWFRDDGAIVHDITHFEYTNIGATCRP